jgi:hypothetical protein
MRELAGEKPVSPALQVPFGRPVQQALPERQDFAHPYCG